MLPKQVIPNPNKHRDVIRENCLKIRYQQQIRYQVADLTQQCLPVLDFDSKSIHAIYAISRLFVPGGEEPD